jgi:cell division septation protein DedD
MSNKQVIAIFVIGIALLLGAFWAGLYVVKQDAEPNSNASVSANQNAQSGQMAKPSTAGASEQAANESAKYVVFVAAYGTLNEAKQLEAQLKSKNYLATYVQMPGAQQPLYRVNIGPYSKDDAEKIAAQLSNERKGLMIFQWTQN